MARAKCCQPPLHGPRRKRGSILKIACAYRHCGNRKVDCKNKPHLLHIDEVDPKQARRLQPKRARFCSVEHMRLCKQKTRSRGGREAPTAEQRITLFHTLKNNQPRAAAMFSDTAAFRCTVPSSNNGVRVLGFDWHFRSDSPVILV